jgi:acyl-CoA thioester hydrolase
MSPFRFFLPIQVRYGDVDAQRHVNNAVYFTYMEQARTAYLQHLGLWDGNDFDAIGIILAETRCTFLAPIRLETPVHVGVRTIRLGTKSMEIAYSIEDASTGQALATGHSVQVAYDYHKAISIPIPDSWRKTITAFEGPDLASVPPGESSRQM